VAEINKKNWQGFIGITGRVSSEYQFSVNKLYLYYFLYILFTGVFLANTFGITEKFIFYNFPTFDVHLQSTFLFSQFFYFIFLHELLKLEDVNIWRKYLLNYIFFISLFLTGIFILSLFKFGVAMKYSDFYTILNISVIVFSFSVLYSKVKRTIKIILAGSLVTVMGALVTILLSFINIYINNLIYFEVGIFIELLLFTIAINYTYSQEIIERQVGDNKNLILKLETIKKEKENLLLKRSIEDYARELTTKSFIIQEKETLLSNIICQLSEINKANNSEYNMKQITDSLRHNLTNTPWSEVEMHFNKVHPNFYSSLNQICSTITSNERKLCAFLKLNLTTKEIAILTGKSVNTIDVARSRFRKKIGLDNTENLQTFIANIG
ncbi:MAG: hypothetical protein JEZ09_21775, partial [Salinivirgaceae bacterium]|nr:hypothetical protein [Salinivirgaceae bacterium]